MNEDRKSKKILEARTEWKEEEEEEDVGHNGNIISDISWEEKGKACKKWRGLQRIGTSSENYFTHPRLERAQMSRKRIIIKCNEKFFEEYL